jgi:hypothetical protein
MTRENDLGRLLKAAFEDEVQAMQIDTGAAARRLERELVASAATRQRRALLLAAVVLLVGVLLGWAAWSGRQDPLPAAPPRDGATSPMTTIPSTWPYLLDLRNGEQVTLPHSVLPQSGGFGTTYGVSSEAARLAFTSCQTEGYVCGGPSTLVIARVDGSERRTVPVPKGQSAHGITWSRDGKRFAYQLTDNTMNALGDLYVYDLATGRSTQVTHLPFGYVWWNSLVWSFSPDGKSLFYDLPRTGQQMTPWDVWSVPLSGGKATLRLRDARAPLVLPDGRIAYVVPRLGTWEGTGIEVSAGSGSRRTLVVARTGIGVLYLSPEGRRIAYGEVDDGTWLLDLSTGDTTRLASGAPGGWFDDHTILVLP